MNKDIFEIKRKSHIDVGVICFWTATINKWQRLLQDDVYKEIIVSSWEYLSLKKLIDVFAFVIMPNHIHVIWRINQKNGKETVQSSFLKYTAHEFKKMLFINESDKLLDYEVGSSNKKHEFWQRDSLATQLFSPNTAFQKMEYIHNNPLTENWQLSNNTWEYKYSTANYYEKGIKSFSFINDLRNEF